MRKRQQWGPNLKALSEFPVGATWENNSRLGPPPRTGLQSNLNLVIPSPGPVSGDRRCEQTVRRGRRSAVSAVSLNRSCPKRRITAYGHREFATLPVQQPSAKLNNVSTPGVASMAVVRADDSRSSCLSVGRLSLVQARLLSPAGGVALKPTHTVRRRGWKSGEGSLKPHQIFNQHFLRQRSAERLTSEEECG